MEFTGHNISVATSIAISNQVQTGGLARCLKLTAWEMALDFMNEGGYNLVLVQRRHDGWSFYLHKDVSNKIYELSYLNDVLVVRRPHD